MSIIEKYLPKCECFQDEDKVADMITGSVTLAQLLAHTMMNKMKDAGWCAKVHQHVMDDAVISMAVAVAITDTIIECGSEDAERETLRVLAGIEARLAEKVKSLYGAVREQQAEGKLPRMNGRGEKLN